MGARCACMAMKYETHSKEKDQMLPVRFTRCGDGADIRTEVQGVGWEWGSPDSLQYKVAHKKSKVCLWDSWRKQEVCIGRIDCVKSAAIKNIMMSSKRVFEAAGLWSPKNLSLRD